MPTPTPDSYTFTPGVPFYAGRRPPVVASFALQNWGGTDSAVLFRGGMPFAMGDIPAGTVPEIRRDGVAVAAQFDERTTWSDGSLKFAVCHMRDTTLAASATHEYEIRAVVGSFDNTGATSLATVASNNALTVEVSSFAQWDGSSSATRGAGAALADFATHAGVATRVTKIHSGSVCEGWQVWGMVKDGADGSGSEDAHLKAIWYVDVWKDADGDVIDTEHAVVLSQDWWGVADKYRLDYTATYKRNGATVETYSSLQHPYHCQWATVRKQDDDNSGRRHWASTVPTLRYAFDKDYWVSTGLVPPYDTEYSPEANTSRVYAPLTSVGHRASLDATGGYQGRGVLPNFDAKTFMRQTSLDFRVSRVCAFAGLHVNRHLRDERTRTRSGESADVANTLIPLLWTPKDASASTIAGLPTPKNAYRGTDTDTADKGGWVAVSGGTGVWTSSSDASHAVAYSAFAYLVEGERYFLEASIDLGTYHPHAANGNEFGGMAWLHWYNNTAARTEMSIPSTQWSANPGLYGQERSIGWAVNCITAAAALLPDNDPQGEYMRGWNSHVADYLAECLLYTPPSVAEAGLTFNSKSDTSGTMRNPWMTSFIVQGLCQNYRSTEVEAYKPYANMVVRSLVAMFTRNKYDLNMYRFVCAPSPVAYNSGNWLASDEYLTNPNGVTVASDVLTPSDVELPLEVADGDTIYFYPLTNDTVDVALPVGYTAGTPLYVVNVSGTTFQVSLTPGGAPTSIPNGTYQFVGDLTGRAGIAVAAFPPYLPPADSYPPIHVAGFALAEAAGLSEVPPGTAAALEAFLANSDRTSYPAWVMKAP